MANDIPAKPLIPYCDGYALDFIKVAAAVFMVNDHINLIWFHHKYLLMIFLGRTTFPLFCYAVAIAVYKISASALPEEAKSARLWRYLKRLILFALITQPLYYFSMPEETVNVIFTLGLGILFADLATRARPWVMYTLFFTGAASMLWDLPIEFGLAGVMIPAAMLMALRGDRKVMPLLALLLLVANAGGAWQGIADGIPPVVWVVVLVEGIFSIVMPWFVLELAHYMPQRGRFLPKYALHVFYPGHMLALKLLARAFF